MKIKLRKLAKLPNDPDVYMVYVDDKELGTLLPYDMDVLEEFKEGLGNDGPHPLLSRPSSVEEIAG